MKRWLARLAPWLITLLLLFWVRKGGDLRDFRVVLEQANWLWLAGALPGGVGLAEVALATLYTQFSITPELAAAVALVYRVTGYWLPRLFGGLFWLWLERQHQLSPQAQEAEL